MSDRLQLQCSIWGDLSESLLICASALKTQAVFEKFSFENSVHKWFINCSANSTSFS